MGDVWLFACPGFERDNTGEGISWRAALDVDGIKEGFAPVAQVHSGGVQHAPHHLECHSDGSLHYGVLFQCVGHGSLMNDTILFTKVINEFLHELRPKIAPNPLEYFA